MQTCVATHLRFARGGQEDQAPQIAERVAELADARLPSTKDHDTSSLREG